MDIHIYCACKKCYQIISDSFKETKLGCIRSEKYKEYVCEKEQYIPLLDLLAGNKNHNMKNKLYDDAFTWNDNRGNKMFCGQDLFLIKYISNNFNKNTKCMDFFAGIGQCALGLYELGFTNQTILECEYRRTFVSKKIILYNNYNIKILTNYFENISDEILDNIDLIFTNNMGNFHEPKKLKETVENHVKIYKKILNTTKKKDIIIPLNAYGIRGVTAYLILEQLENEQNLNLDVFYADYSITSRHNFLRISNYKYKEFDKISDHFKKLYTINSKNIETILIKDNQNLFPSLPSIHIHLLDDIKHGSFGIYFTKPNRLNENDLKIPKHNPSDSWLKRQTKHLIEAKKYYPNILDTYEPKLIDKYYKYMKDGLYTFTFYAKSNKTCKLKIYTGKKWIKLTDDLINEYSKYEITDYFSFSSSSTYRIGVVSINDYKNIDIFILNPIFL